MEPMPNAPPAIPQDARPDRPGAGPAVVPVDVHGLVSELAARLAAQALRQAVQINVGPPAVARHALADPQRLRLVLTKVLGNAIRFNRDRGRVDVRLTLLDPSAVAISVSDTGCGMSPGDIARAFEPCDSQAADCARRHLDTPCLAAARATARAMNGDLVAASAVGVGSTFVVSLPAAAPRGEPDASR